MESRIEFELKPITDAASTGGGYRAILTTANGNTLDFEASNLQGWPPRKPCKTAAHFGGT